MRINSLVCFTFFISATAIAELNRTALIESCSAQGESEKVCECMAQRWLASLQPSEMDTASKMVAMMNQQQRPSPQDMQTMQGLMGRMQQFGMACAMDSPVEDETPANIQDFLPPGALNAKDASDLNAIINGSDNSFERMQQMDQRREIAREEERQSREAIQAEQDRQLKQDREALRNELRRLEQRDILDYQVSDFKHAFELRSRVYNVPQEQYRCQWAKLSQIAGSDKGGVLAAYYVVSGGGDYDQPPNRRPYLVAAKNKYEDYQSARDTCE